MSSVPFETIQRDSVITFPGLLGELTLNPPAYITIFGKNIYFYGVLIALGFMLAILFCSRKSKDFGIKADDFYDLMIWLIPVSILGARAYYVLFRLGDYLSRPLSVFAVWEGGLAIYGGVIAGILTVILVCRHKKIPFTAMLDLVIPGLLIGQILGRWGNFMNREAFGAETEIFFIFLLVFDKKGKRKYDGQNTLIYFLWYGLGRAWIEGLRTDSLYIGSTGIRVSQALSIVLCLAALAALVILGRKAHRPEELFVNRVKAAKEAAENTEEQTT